MRSIAVASFIATSFVISAACSSTGNNPGDASTISGVTYYKDIVPIIQTHCQMCHTTGGIAPFTLLSYDDAHANSDGMVADTQAKIMPPWGAQNTSECTVRYPFKGDISLSAQEIATIASWHTDGDVAGDPKDAPPPVTTTLPTDLPGTPTNLAPSTPYSLPAGQTTDYFRCYVLDPQFTAQTFITGFNIKPGNKTIVHHSLVFAVPSTATIPPPSDGVPNQYDCFGGPGVSNPSLVALWTPGGVPYQYPDGVAQPIDAGTKFIMQIHYHPHANATPDPDTTTFQFTTTSVTQSWTVGTALLGNFTNAVTNGTGLEQLPFTIPADTDNVVRTMDDVVCEDQTADLGASADGGRAHAPRRRRRENHRTPREPRREQPRRRVSLASAAMELQLAARLSIRLARHAITPRVLARRLALDALHVQQHDAKPNPRGVAHRGGSKTNIAREPRRDDQRRDVSRRVLVRLPNSLNGVAALQQNEERYQHEHGEQIEDGPRISRELPIHESPRAGEIVGLDLRDGALEVAVFDEVGRARQTRLVQDR